jgi:serum/glucocorticoid-regulated kinase 2
MFESEFRDEIFEALKYMFWRISQHNLPVFGVHDKLKDYATSKKDISNGIAIMPKDNYRIIEEDIYQEASGSNKSTNAAYSVIEDLDEWNNEIKNSVATNLYNRKQNRQASLGDFTIKSVIGRGSFGKVFLVQKKDTMKVYAMKSLRKDVIIDYDQIESTLLEKKILLEANHPFLVGMEFVFQTDNKIFFVMKFVRGGELFMHLRKLKNFPEKRAKYYALTVALALGHLHSKNIIYRDLKPENILMDEDGYICLTDFGLAKILEQNEQAYSFCGTPEYLAPEIISEQGHSFPVDWWALGILTYEMIVGFPPFYTGNQNNQKMYELIQKKKVFFPDSKKHGIAMSEQCQDFIN